MRHPLAVVIALALALTACSGETQSADTRVTSPEEAAEALPTIDPDRQIQRLARIEADIEAEASGAVGFRWRGRAPILMTRVGGIDLQANLLTMGFPEPVVVPDNRIQRFRWAFDLLNAYNDEPGTFTMPAHAAGEQKLASSMYLISLQVKEHAQAKDQVQDQADVERLVTFSKLAAPCTVEIGPGELSGSITCPKLQSETDEEVAVTVRWRNGHATPVETPTASE